MGLDSFFGASQFLDCLRPAYIDPALDFLSSIHTLYRALVSVSIRPFARERLAHAILHTGMNIISYRQFLKHSIHRST